MRPGPENKLLPTLKIPANLKRKSDETQLTANSIKTTLTLVKFFDSYLLFNLLLYS